MLNEEKVNKKRIIKIPKEPGIYFFYNKSGKILYIGKAINLRNRVKSHFTKSNYRDNFFIKETEEISYIPLSSEVEALILESQLIKKKEPKFNVLFRDDKKYFYVGITHENWPRIFLTHQPQNKKEYIGPFTDGSSLKEVLKILRKIFPYRSCINLPRKSCLWYDLSRCPAPCLIEKEKSIRKKLLLQTKKRQKEYKNNIKKIKEILEGKRQKVLKDFRKEMRELSKKEEFEKALIIRDKIEALSQVFSHKTIFDNQKINQKIENEGEILKKTLYLPKTLRRIEGYDISNIKSKEMVGAMVVFGLNKNGKYSPNKKEYRLFKIKTIKKQNDIACFREIISRRFKHNEWKMPNLIYVDGGKAQFNVVNKTMQRTANNKQLRIIPIISLAKKTNILYTNIFDSPISIDKLGNIAKMTILRLRDESHRFAISYHKKLRKKSFGI